MRGYAEHAGTGVHGTAAFSGTGVRGQSEVGPGVEGSSVNGPGGSFFASGSTPAILATGSGAQGRGIEASGARGQVRLVPNATDPAKTAASDKAGTLWQQGTYTGGDYTASALWTCVKDGAPGTWRKVAGLDTAGAFHLLPVPVRVYDSRAGSSPAQGPKTPLAGNAARTIDCKVNGSGVPAGAAGVVLTVLLVNAANGGGNLTIWAAGAARPSANTMVWGGSAGRFTASAISSLDAQARVQVSASLSTDVVLDVVGYYR